jgi:uncharacterized protein YhhL (DUF1145 family)
MVPFLDAHLHCAFFLPGDLQVQLEVLTIFMVLVHGRLLFGIPNHNDVGESGEDEIRTRAGILLFDEMKLLSYLRRCDLNSLLNLTW